MLRMPSCRPWMPARLTLYRKINRPHPDVTFERLVDGLVAFRKEYRGKLWVEVMLIKGLNDTSQALEDIAKVLQKVGPDAVHINLPTLPTSLKPGCNRRMQKD